MVNAFKRSEEKHILALNRIINPTSDQRLSAIIGETPLAQEVRLQILHVINALRQSEVKH